MHYLFPFKRFSLLAATLLCLFTGAQGQDFWSNGIHYNLTDDNTAEVMYMDCDYGWYETYYNYYEQYSGDIVIPSEVSAWVYPMYDEPFEVTATVTGIGDYAFCNCESLNSVTLPSTLKRIGENAFYQCPSLTSINLPEGLNSIGDVAFGYSGLQSIVIPSSVTDLGWSLFYCCENLTTATIGDGITELYGTFLFCTALKTVNLPNTLAELDMTFKGCTQLETIDLPSTVINVGDETFYNCDMLANITCRPVTPPSAYDNNCFYSTNNFIFNNAFLRVPGESLNSYQNAEVWKNFLNITAIGGGNIIPGDVDGDGELTIGDVTDLIDLLLAYATAEDYPSGDVNGDGEIAIDDLTDLIDIILGF